jgi:hypothetical protein
MKLPDIAAKMKRVGRALFGAAEPRSLGEASPGDSPSSISKARGKIVARVQSHLTDIGFSIHDKTTSWRIGNVKTDIFHFDMLTPALCRKWRVPIGSFGVFPMCFFPALPSLSDSWEKCDASLPLPIPPPARRAQLRYQSLKTIQQSKCPQRTIYCFSKEESEIDRIIKDILQTIDCKLSRFWSQYNDPRELLRSLKQDEQIGGPTEEGIVDVGSIGSHIRLFYLGFTALWLEEYALAASVLTECRAHKKWLPSGMLGDFDTRPVLDCLDKGLLYARERLTNAGC